RMNAVDPGMAATWRGRMAGRRVGRGYPTHAEALAAFRFVPAERGVPPAVIADLAHHAIPERGPDDWTFPFDRAVLSLEGDRAGGLRALLGGVRFPAVLMAGAESWVMDAAQRDAVAAAVPDCTVRVFPGGHHFLLAHAPVVAATLRTFLDGLPARERGR